MNTACTCPAAWIETFIIVHCSLPSMRVPAMHRVRHTGEQMYAEDKEKDASLFI